MNLILNSLNLLIERRISYRMILSLPHKSHFFKSYDQKIIGKFIKFSLQQALLDGRNIHLFDQKADELLERLAEKEAHLLAMNDEQWAGMELAQVLGQMERYSTEFMHSLEVLAKQASFCLKPTNLCGFQINIFEFL